MNWWRESKLYGRRTLDRRYEFDISDRTDKWIARAEQRQRERRTRPQRSLPITMASTVTASSSAVVMP